MRQIERRIVQVWPDMIPGRPDWTIYAAHPSVLDGFVPALDHSSSVFVLKAEADLNQDQFQRSLIILSLRTWNLATGHFTATPLSAFVVDTQMVVKELFQMINFHQRCDLSPCALELNGDVMQTWHHEYPIVNWDGGYTQVQASIRLDRVLDTTAGHTAQGVPTADELPARFQQLVITSMHDRGLEDDGLILATIQFQTSLTCWARSVYDFTKMEGIHQRDFGVFLQEANSIVFLRFASDIPRDAVKVYYDITQYIAVQIRPEGLGAPFCKTRMASPTCTSYNLAEPNLYLLTKWQSKLTVTYKMVPKIARLASVGSCLASTE